MKQTPWLVYLACPYSDNDPAIALARFNAVNKLAAQLMQFGEFIISPISHTHPIAQAGKLPGGWDYWEQYDRALIACCSKMIVYMLAGWEYSQGVQAEITIAKELGIPLEYIPQPDDYVDTLPLF
jgi:hypothetical protein